MSELKDTVNSLDRRADEQQLGFAMQASSSSLSSHYLPDVLSTFRESVPSQEEAVNATHHAQVDPILNTVAQEAPDEATAVHDPASASEPSADRSG